MQTTKSRNGSLDMPQRTSPATPRTARQFKSGGSDSNPVPSPHHNKNLKSHSPKIMQRASPKSPITEKKYISKVSELEIQLSQHQEELKKTKEQLSSFEAQKIQAQQEAEETRSQLSSLSTKLEESQQQVELLDSEESRLQELRKIFQDRDRVWQSELEALQKQHAMDTAALASSINEIHRLKKQLQKVAESEDSKCRDTESVHLEVQNLRIKLSETLQLVEKMKSQLADSKKSEGRAFEVVSEAQVQLEATKATAEAIRSVSLKAVEAYNGLASELEQSNAQVSTLEYHVTQLQVDLSTRNVETLREKDGHKDEETDKLKVEIDSLKLEVGQLKSALDVSEIRYQEEYIDSTLQIRSAYEAVEHAKAESNLKEAELEEELKRSKDAIQELKYDLTLKQKTLQNISLENEELSIKILETRTSIKESEVKKLEVDLTHLKTGLLDKESQIQTLAEENETLRTEMSKRANEEAVALAQAAKEAEKNNCRAAKVVEQLQASQMANADLEAELRRLKVQAEQWRKAAEAAASMLSPGRDAKLVDRTFSLDSSYHTIRMKMDLPFSDNIDYDYPKKKNANMLKKIGGLWKNPR